MIRGSLLMRSTGIAALALAIAASPAAAQRRLPARTALQPAIQVIEARGSDPRRSDLERRRAGEPPAARSTTEKAEIVRAALNLSSAGLVHVGVPLRLTPTTPFFKGQASLEIEAASMVSFDEKGGMIWLTPKDTTLLPNVACYFKPTAVDQPILVEFSVGSPAYSTFSPPSAKIVLTGTGGLKQDYTLPPGSHHLSVVIKPKDLEWKTVRLNAWKTGDDYTLLVYACEVTGIQK